MSKICNLHVWCNLQELVGQYPADLPWLYLYLDFLRHIFLANINTGNHIGAQSVYIVKLHDAPVPCAVDMFIYERYDLTVGVFHDSPVKIPPDCSGG